jgi:DDE superfamily endonuclease
MTPARCTIPAKPEQIERYDCEYRRNGTANLFVFLDVNRPWRKVKVTERRAAEDFAACMRELTDVHYPEAERIRVVLDSLSTHSAGALYQTFWADEARRVLRRLEFHYTPVGSTWWRSRSASWSANASTGVSKPTRASSPRLPPGRSGAMPNALASIGCSQKAPPGLSQARRRIRPAPKTSVTRY